MVKHIILWTLNPELSEAEKQEVKAGIKAGLEGLVGKVPGLLDVKVHIDGRLASSNADVMWLWLTVRFAPTPCSAAVSTLRSKRKSPPTGGDYSNLTKGTVPFVRKEDLLLVDSQVDGNGYRNRSTYHRVVTHAEEAHHLYVSRY